MAASSFDPRNPRGGGPERAVPGRRSRADPIGWGCYAGDTLEFAGHPRRGRYPSSK